jgi:hypothetical protein
MLEMEYFRPIQIFNVALTPRVAAIKSGRCRPDPSAQWHLLAAVFALWIPSIKRWQSYLLCRYGVQYMVGHIPSCEERKSPSAVPGHGGIPFTPTWTTFPRILQPASRPSIFATRHVGNHITTVFSWLVKTLHRAYQGSAKLGGFLFKRTCARRVARQYALFLTSCPSLSRNESSLVLSCSY